MSETVDLTRIRAGDEVLVRAVVRRVDRHTVDCVTADQQPARFTVFAEAIVSHARKALAVGDRVMPRDSVIGGEIVAISGAFAWVRDGSGCHWTEKLARLEPSNA